MVDEAVVRLVAVICQDDVVLAAALVHTVGDLYGLRISATVHTAEAALTATASVQPDLVVIDLALAGERGLRIVRQLQQVAPGCAVVVAAPPEFGDLRLDAVAAGAVTLIETCDLRPLQCSIERLTHVHGENCPSCAARERESYWRREPLTAG